MVCITSALSGWAHYRAGFKPD